MVGLLNFQSRPSPSFKNEKSIIYITSNFRPSMHNPIRLAIAMEKIAKKKRRPPTPPPPPEGAAAAGSARG